MTAVITVEDGDEKLVVHDIPVYLDGVLTEELRIEYRTEAADILWPIGVPAELLGMSVNGVEVERIKVRQDNAGAPIHVTTTPKENAP